HGDLRDLHSFPTRRSSDLDATYTLEPAQDGERSVELRRVGKGKNLIIAFHGPSMAHPDAASLEVMSGILAGRGGVGRLDKALVGTKKEFNVRLAVGGKHEPRLITPSATPHHDPA